MASLGRLIELASGGLRLPGSPAYRGIVSVLCRRWRDRLSMRQAYVAAAGFHADNTLAHMGLFRSAASPFPSGVRRVAADAGVYHVFCGKP